MDVRSTWLYCPQRSRIPECGPKSENNNVCVVWETKDDKKHQIAKRYLVPKQVKNHGIKRSEITFNSRVLNSIIRNYTKEAGVRNLEKESLLALLLALAVVVTNFSENDPIGFEN